MSDRALVVFCHDTSIWWLRFLKEGFRHCFILVEVGCDEWVAIDPLANRIEITAPIRASLDDLCASFEAHGHRSISTRLRDDPPAGCLMSLFSCVDLVKRVLRLRRPMIFTPYQLYIYLTTHKGD